LSFDKMFTDCNFRIKKKMETIKKQINQNPDLKKIISFRITENEYELLNKKIKKSGKKKSEFFRTISKQIILSNNKLKSVTL